MMTYYQFNMLVTCIPNFMLESFTVKQCSSSFLLLKGRSCMLCNLQQQVGDLMRIIYSTAQCKTDANRSPDERLAQNAQNTPH